VTRIDKSITIRIRNGTENDLFFELDRDTAFRKVMDLYKYIISHDGEELEFWFSSILLDLTSITVEVSDS